MINLSETRVQHRRTSSVTPDFTEPVIGPAKGGTHWFNPDYEFIPGPTPHVGRTGLCNYPRTE
jgi:hypothetical protein